jgi:hypothetical protein
MTMTQTYLPIRTTDTRWARANGATVHDGERGWLVPVDSLEPFTFCGREWVRHTFPTAPRDGMTVIAAPKEWIR